MLRYLLPLFALLPLSAQSQLHHPVLTGLEGPALLQALQDNYQPAFVLPFSDARDTLFGRIDARNDTLYCVYTGFPVYLPPDEDPTTAAFQDGQGINTEHAYPRSKGASFGRPQADMHHLYPSRVDVNADRGNLPFGDVPGNQGSKWYLLAQEFSARPANDTGQYSVLGQTVFEPRDAYKGDIARAMFYFYTVYRQEADAEDPAFFELQRETFCRWQAQDPVDEEEWERTHGISAHQDGKRNPFVLDCTLATRTYCDGVVPPCTPPPVSVRDVSAAELALQAFPNPASGQLQLRYELPQAGSVEVELLNALGQVLSAERLGPQTAGLQEHTLSLPAAAGIYLCRLRLGVGHVGMVRIVVR